MKKKEYIHNINGYESNGWKHRWRKDADGVKKVAGLVLH